MGIMDGNPKNEPMHYGEIYHVWQFSTMAKGIVSCFQAYISHAGDQDLKKLLQDAIAQAKQEIMECDKLLTDNGITPMATLPERPVVHVEEIPTGARFTDMEIAAHLAADISAGLLACSEIIGLSLREDIGALFAKYHAAKTALGTRVLRTSKDKGWIAVPPLQTKKPEPVTV